MSTRSAAPTRRRQSRKRGAPQVRIEEYSDRRVAEFLLSNTVDGKDYARAVRLVRQLGLDPARIDHDKPPGVA